MSKKGKITLCLLLVTLLAMGLISAIDRAHRQRLDEAMEDYERQ